MQMKRRPSPACPLHTRPAWREYRGALFHGGNKRVMKLEKISCRGNVTFPLQSGQHAFGLINTLHPQAPLRMKRGEGTRGGTKI